MAGAHVPAVGGEGNRNWASIASLNISRRQKTNTLEVRLENETGSGSSLNTEEIERLLRRLKVNPSQFSMIQACPERKNVVYITFVQGVDNTKFLANQTKSYILKEGIRTTTIRPVGKRDVLVTVYGLHPDTRDEGVIQYLSAYGEVNKKDPVVYGVYPGVPGSSIIAGKYNGNRSYMVEVKRNRGTYHIIDGEKVTIKYRGQIKTCAKCHQSQHTCPGKGLARDCSAERVLLSDHMKNHWEEINFKPNTADMNEVDITTDDEIEKVSASQTKENKTSFKEPDPDTLKKCTGVVIPGDCDIGSLIRFLKECGLAEEFTQEDLLFKENRKTKTVYVHDLSPETSMKLIRNSQDREFQGKKLSVFTLVEDTPSKKVSPNSDSLSAVGSTEGTNSKFWRDKNSTDSNTDESNSENEVDITADFVFENAESFKRKAGSSPSIISPSQQKKEKKKARKANKKEAFSPNPK